MDVVSLEGIRRRFRSSSHKRMKPRTGVELDGASGKSGIASEMHPKRLDNGFYDPPRLAFATCSAGARFRIRARRPRRSEGILTADLRSLRRSTFRQASKRCASTRTPVLAEALTDAIVFRQSSFGSKRPRRRSARGIRDERHLRYRRYRGAKEKRSGRV